MKGPDEVKKIFDKQNAPTFFKAQLQPSSIKHSLLAQKVDLEALENKSVGSNNNETIEKF